MAFAWLTPRLGFEVELLAPRGRSRRDLAEAIAERIGGDTRSVFHRDTELSLVAGRPVFHHLTKGYEVYGRSGELRCRLVDDVTIVDDLDPTAGPKDGWFRILSDEPRLLRLVERLVDPSADAATILDPVASLFGVATTTTPSGRFAVNDSTGATVAMVSAEAGERERVCEVITPPLAQDRLGQLEELLCEARALGFTVPAEAAVHLHLDAEPFREPQRFARLVRLFGAHREELRARFGTNPHCRRLGPLPADLVDWAAELESGPRRTWESVEAELSRFALTKYCDLNLTNLRARLPHKDTVEVRIFPGSDDGATIVAWAAQLDELLAGC